MQFDSSTGHTLQTSLELSRHVFKIWQKIKVEVYYLPELLQKKITGSVSLQIRVDRSGKLSFFNEDSISGPSVLRGWVVNGVTEALKEGFIDPPMTRSAELRLRFLFAIGSGPPGTIPDAKIDGDVLFFHILGSAPIFLPSQQRVSRDSDGEIILHRQQWDFFERLKMYSDACDFRQAEGGCQKAAELYRNANKPIKVQEYLAKACKLGMPESCLKPI